MLAMTRPTFLSLFSGIGGLDLGLERAGWECVGQVEIDPFCQRVLAKHWPDVPRWGDIREVDPDDLPRADLIVGGFPCQPVSSAGKRLGWKDPRWLWPDMSRLVRVLRPRWVLLENVPGLLVRAMGDVLGDLAAFWGDAEWRCVSAADVGAPHIRDRVFVLAYPQRPGWDGLHERVAPGYLATDAQGSRPHGANWPAAEDHSRGVPRQGPQGGDVGHSNGQGRLQPCWVFGEKWRRPGHASWWSREPDVARVAYGIPGGMDRRRALGNAVVPQVAELIGRRILEADAA